MAIPTLHFACIVVIPDSAAPVPGRKPPSEPSPQAIVVFENNFDGTLDSYLAQLLAMASAEVHEIFRCCHDYRVADGSRTGEIEAYLRAHAVHPAAYHVGNFGRSAKRVLEEQELFGTMEQGLDARMSGGAHPRDDAAAHALVRAVLDGDAKAKAIVGHPFEGPSWWDRVGGPWAQLAARLPIAILALIALPIYLPVLRSHEEADAVLQPGDIDPRHAVAMAELEDREHRVQNHFVSITNVKRGAFRRLSLRFVLWGANLIARTSTNGTLSGIPSIHFAHWSLLDGGTRLLFLTNFDGSWENYLDDFIDKASTGLTGIWTHSDGFPKTSYLVREGSRNGEAFKAYARASQVSEAVWYTAYPRLTVQRIDTHSAVREGLASGLSEDARRDWLAKW